MLLIKILDSFYLSILDTDFDRNKIIIPDAAQRCNLNACYYIPNIKEPQGMSEMTRLRLYHQTGKKTLTRVIPETTCDIDHDKDTYIGWIIGSTGCYLVYRPEDKKYITVSRLYGGDSLLYTHDPFLTLRMRAMLDVLLLEHELIHKSDGDLLNTIAGKLLAYYNEIYPSKITKLVKIDVNSLNYDRKDNADLIDDSYPIIKPIPLRDYQEIRDEYFHNKYTIQSTIQEN